MALIDNESLILEEELKKSLIETDRLDVISGFFYFSGFKLLSDDLIDKKIRILVGLEVDPTLIPQIVQLSKDADEDLNRWQPRRETKSRTELKENYLEAFKSFMNDSDIFDDPETFKIFQIFMEKLKNGTMEIRKTLKDDHSKVFVLHDKKDNLKNKDSSGVVFMGSGNFTYNGLKGQSEITEKFTDQKKYLEYKNHFEELWNESESISIVSKNNYEEFFNRIKTEIWPYAETSPFEIYLRVLHELFEQKEDEILSPSTITNGLYSDLEYQTDAIKIGIDKLNQFDGLILADVVGLGKSIIASAISRNLDINTVIISPPHLIPQWEDYKEQFGIRGSKVFSSGMIKNVYERYEESREPILFILDEAHRFRNEETEDYKMLHQLARSHPENKVLLLTATPFNNDPKDVFALIKLFQTPGQSTINSIDSLSIRYRELIERYKKLRRNINKGLEESEIEKEAREIANEQRKLIEPIVLRRSRLDLEYITRYKDNLEENNISFPDIKGPDFIEYNLGEISDLYSETLSLITETENKGFIGARYKPTDYFTSQGRKNFVAKYKQEIDSKDLRVAQRNLASFMKRLLVMRFESSKFAFKNTLKNLINSNKVIINWWEKEGVVPIMKKGTIPNPDDYENETEDGQVSNDFVETIQDLRKNKGLLEINSTDLNENFIKDVRHDLELLKNIYDLWFNNEKIKNLDPKVDTLREKINELRNKNLDKKIVLFSSYKDTVDNLFEELNKKNINGVIKYSASEASKENKKIIKENFDASISQNEQKDDYQILIATDALSEGFNLHRAGVVINIDIPYNPTKVIQRVGRINRINKKVFNEIEIYNCFPSSIGETAVKIKSITTLKIKLVNFVIGSDTKTLTKDEELKSFFKDELNKAEEQSNQLSWDAPHIQIYENFKSNERIFSNILSLPRRSRIKVKNSIKNLTVVFGKKGNNAIFTLGDLNGDAKVISAEEGLSYFSAEKGEKGTAVDNKFTSAFELAKNKLFSKPEIANIKGRRASSIKILKALGSTIAEAKDYCEDIIDIIKELDDINEGVLKDISRLDLNDLDKSYKKLKNIIPISSIKNIRQKAKRYEDFEEFLLFTKQLEK